MFCPLTVKATDHCEQLLISDLYLGQMMKYRQRRPDPGYNMVADGWAGA